MRPRGCHRRGSPPSRSTAGPRRFVALAASVAFTACGEPSGAAAGDPVTVTDSAGVTIVSAAPGPADSIPMGPSLTVGREGDPDYEFFQIQMVLGLASGNVVVANGGTSELRFYGPDGTFLRSVGQRGEGPAEFGSLTTVFVLEGDTLAAKDARRRRLLYFDSAGVFVRGESFEADLSVDRPDRVTDLCLQPSLAGMLGSGARLVNGWSCLDLQRADGIRDWPIGLYVADQGELAKVGDFSRATAWERGEFQRPQRPFTPLPLVGSVRYGTHGDRIFVSRGRDYQVEVYDRRATLVSILRELAMPPLITAADRNRYEAEREAAGAPLASDVPYPERLGSYDQLVISHEGDVWAGRQPPPGGAQREWVVFRAGGEAVRRVRLPAEYQLQSVRGGRALGYVTDPLDIQTVVGMDVER